MHAQNITLPAGTASGVIANGGGRLLWHSFKETTGAASASYTFYDGNAPGKRIVLPVSLVASESTRDYMGRHGIPFEQGLYFSIDAGTVEGNIVIELDDNPGAYVVPVVVVSSAQTFLVPQIAIP